MKRHQLFAILLALTLLLTACGTGRSTDPQTNQPSHEKPIASITLSSRNGYARMSGFAYLTPTQVAMGDIHDYTVLEGDPIADPGAWHMTVADIPAGAFDKICAELWALRFDLLPAKVTQPEDRAVADDSNYCITVRFEDGTTFTSEGYAACYYLEDFGTVWSHLQKQAGKLMDKYEVPEKEVREIAAVLCYTYNGLDAASGENGYIFHYYSPLVYLTGQTAVPTAKVVDSDGSINFQRLENDWGDGYQEKFNPLIRELRKLSPEKLPEVIEPDSKHVIPDGNTQYIVIYFADGTTVTSSGYCASEYNEQFAAVWDLLRRYRIEVPMAHNNG